MVYTNGVTKMKLERIFYWLLVAYIMYITIEVARIILGGSLGFEEILIALLVGNIALTFKLQYQIGKLNSKLQYQIGQLDSKLQEHLGWHRGKET